ncbi:PspC domain-containing protein [Fusibacter ferrireducens]|uniref:PspC domain-containing protein n=1 Tax=Fusibacter ferrireducens TaxID=2785058 RepID=A0ABR9ZTI7_9FIRM|nr:PspC domain-containing protein [Fusibacter ferrireducens]MBF4693779.1 PspC domain-containing protein [Fusibacter ferrireducens]
MAGRQLCKIKSRGHVSGVCAGLSEYFGVDVSIIRLIWVLAIFFGVGSPVIIYFIMAIILPEYDPDSVYFEEYVDDDDEYDDRDRY